MEDTQIYFGGTVKALGGGRVAGMGLLFTTINDPDVEGEFFTKSTNIGMGVGDRRDIYYRHGVHPIIQDRELGTATLKEIDEEGAFFEGELNLRDKYEKYIYKLAEMGKLGWSTGALTHLLKKEIKELGGKKATEIKKWIIGEISLTPCPVEARTSAFPIKSIEGEVDELDSFIKEKEDEELDQEFSIDGIPSLKSFCEAVAPNSLKNGLHRSQAAADAVKGFITYTRILGEAYDSYTSRLVKRTENRFLKEGRELDSSTIAQNEQAIADIEKIETAYTSVKESLLGIRKISEMTKAEQKAMDEKARLALWNYSRISGYEPKELNDGSTSQHV